MPEFSEESERDRLYAALAAAHRRESWLSAATDVITLMLLAEDPRAVLNLVADRARYASGVDNCSLLLRRDDGEWGIDVSGGHLADEIRGTEVPEWAASVQATMTGRTLLVNDPEHSEYRIAEQFQRFGALVYSPLAHREGQPIGTLILANRREGRLFDDEDARLAAAFANQAGLALVLTEARGAEDRLAVLADRERIARDLHDLTIQRIFAVGLHLQALRRRVTAPDFSADAAVERLDTVIDELDAAIAEIRSAIFELQPTAEQEAASVRARVLREAQKASATLGFEPSVTFDGPVDARVSETIAAHLLAAVRESLANAAKHADATKVDVSVRLSGHELALEVRDDGPHPPPEWRPAHGATAHHGLGNLDARAVELGGWFRVGPGEGGVGTHLRWYVPV